MRVHAAAQGLRKALPMAAVGNIEQVAQARFSDFVQTSGHYKLR